MRATLFALLCASLSLAGCGLGGQASPTSPTADTDKSASPSPDGTESITPGKDHAQAIAGDYSPEQLAGVWKALATEEERRQAKREGLDIDSSLPTLSLGKDGSFIFSEPEGQMSGSFEVSGSTVSLRVDTAFGKKVDPKVYRTPVLEVAEKGKSLLTPPGPDGSRLEFRRK